MKKNSKKKNNKGFTLIELLVVIAIIGILAVVAVPALFKNIEKAKIADLESDISAIRSASLAYYSDNSQYPTGNMTKDATDDTVPADMKSEVENLSFPFDSTYNIALGKEANTKNLELTISGGKALSQAGFDKLEKDLGKTVVTGSPSAPIITTIKAN